jgi:hypothetical protein
MHLYWRVIEELKYLGERWEIIDPAMLRRYELWKQKHADSINIIFRKGPIALESSAYFCKGTDSIN